MFMIWDNWDFVRLLDPFLYCEKASSSVARGFKLSFVLRDFCKFADFAKENFVLNHSQKNWTTNSTESTFRQCNVWLSIFDSSLCSSPAFVVAIVETSTSRAKFTWLEIRLLP